MERLPQDGPASLADRGCPLSHSLTTQVTAERKQADMMGGNPQAVSYVTRNPNVLCKQTWTSGFVVMATVQGGQTDPVTVAGSRTGQISSWDPAGTPCQHGPIS